MNLLQKRTLWNRLTAWHRFYSAKMSDRDRLTAHLTRIRQFAGDMKEMNVTISGQELCMKILCSLLQRFEHLKVAIITTAEDDKLTVKLVRSQILQ